MDKFEREESQARDQWIRNYMQEHGVSYTEGYKALGKQLRADRLAEESKAYRAQDERQIYIRNYQQQTGSTRRQAENHVDRHMPHLRAYGSFIHEVAALIQNPQVENDEHCMKSFLMYFKDNPDMAKKCAGDFVADTGDYIARTRVTPGGGQFFGEKLREAMNEVLRVNPDIAEMYQNGRASESAVHTIFFFRFSDGKPYDIAANHSGISHLGR